MEASARVADCAGRGGGSRVLQTMLVFVCALSVVGGFILAAQFSSMAGIYNQDGDVPLVGSKWLSRPALQTSEVAIAEVTVVGDEVKMNRRRLVSRIGFGSCTSRVAIAQPIWGNGIIPSDIDAWIWCAV